MPSATDFLPLCITMLMKRAMSWLPCFGSGRITRAGWEPLRDMSINPWDAWRRTWNATCGAWQCRRSPASHARCGSARPAGPYAAAADQHHRVFLKVVAFAADVADDFVAVGQAHLRHLAHGRIRLLRRGGIHARAHAATLRAVLQRGRRALVGLRAARSAHQLVDSCHSGYVLEKRVSWEKPRADRITGLPRSGILTRNRETGQAFAPFWLPALEHEARPLRLISMVAARAKRAACSSSSRRLRRFAVHLARFFEDGGHVGKGFHFRVGQSHRRLALRVVGKTRTGRNQATNYNVFLEATQVVALAAHCGIGQHARGLLERRRRNERLGRQGCLGDAQQHRDCLGRPLVAGFGLAVGFEERIAVHLLAAQVRGIAGFADLDLAQHLADDRLDVLVVDLDTLQPVHVLDFLDEISRQPLDTEQAQDVARIGLAVHHRLALLDVLALEHHDVAPLRDQVLVLVAFRILDDQALLALGVLAEADHARNLREDRRFLRLAGLEQVRDAGQAAGDVAGLGRLLRDARDHVADADLGPVLDRHDRTGRQVRLRRNVGAGQFQVLALLVFQTHRRTQVLGIAAAALRIGDHHAFETGQLVDRRLHGHAIDEVDVAHPARHLGDDRVGMRIPVRDRLASLDLGTVPGREGRAVGDLVALALTTLDVDQADVAGTRDRNQMALRMLHGLQVVELQRAGGLDGHVVHRGRARSRAADVEGTHRQLGAGFADRLRGDHANRLADVDDVSARQVAPVAQRTYAELGFTGDGRTHLHALHAGLVEFLDQRFVEQRVALHDRFVVIARCIDVLDRDTAEHAIAQRLDDVAALHDRSHGQALEGAAIVLGHHHVLGHIDETPGQVTRVRRLQRGVGQALAGAVGGDEVLQDVQAFAEIGLDGRLDDRAVRLGHQSAHAGELADLRRRTTRAGVGHDVDRVHRLLVVDLAVGTLDVVEADAFHHRGRDLLVGARPDVHHLVVAFACGDET